MPFHHFPLSHSFMKSFFNLSFQRCTFHLPFISALTCFSLFFLQKKVCSFSNPTILSLIPKVPDCLSRLLFYYQICQRLLHNIWSWNDCLQNSYSSPQKKKKNRQWALTVHASIDQHYFSLHSSYWTCYIQSQVVISNLEQSSGSLSVWHHSGALHRYLLWSKKK